jgi:3-hydroxyacyl-CoA dehydrogenase/enoyl-CoA hydratase/3-hydroxybutyryl-CoA epimerase
MIGAASAVEICADLAARHGPRFAPPALLIDMAAKGAQFYGTGAKALSTS